MLKRLKILEPSLLAADPGKMAEQMASAERGGADEWHFDVMDGHFVPNISFGPHVCKGLSKYTNKPINAHLMLAKPWKFIGSFIESNAASITIHAEVGDARKITETLKEIHKAGAKAGIALNPNTPIEEVLPYLELVERVLLMSVEPGFGGQSFMPESLKRLEALRAEIDKVNQGIHIQIDGGINLENAPLALRAGADILIAGNSVFGAEDIEERCREFTGLLSCNNP